MSEHGSSTAIAGRFMTKGGTRKDINADWPVFVVSLASDTARRERISKQLEGLGIAFTFMDAVDGRTCLPRWTDDLVDQDGTRGKLGRPLSGPEIGCALSHQLIYERIKSEGLPGAIVLEDDAELRPGFRDFLQNRCFERADLIQLHYIECRVFLFGRRALMSGYRIARVATRSASTVAYSISARGAVYLRSEGLPLVATADWPCDTTQIGHSVVMPMVVGHLQECKMPSQIEQERTAARRNQVAIKNPGRFLRRSYWRTWLRKRLSVRIA